jgi:hypothetical protein
VKDEWLSDRNSIVPSREVEKVNVENTFIISIFLALIWTIALLRIIPSGFGVSITLWSFIALWSYMKLHVNRSRKSYRKCKSENGANTSLRIYQRWDQVLKRSKHSLSTGHIHLEAISRSGKRYELLSRSVCQERVIIYIPFKIFSLIWRPYHYCTSEGNLGFVTGFDCFNSVSFCLKMTGFFFSDFLYSESDVSTFRFK